MGTRYLTCVLDNGSDRSLSVPANPRQALRMTQGSTMLLILKVVHNDGTPVALTAAPVFAIKKTGRQDQADVLLTSTLAPIRGVNYAVVTIDATATKYMEPGRFVYDVWLTQDGSRDPIIPYSQFVLEPGLQLP